MDEKIIQLWRDPSFSGSYRGIKTFQMFLKTDQNINVSEKKLYSIMMKDPIYVMHLQRKKVNRRHYYLSNVGELVQSDLAYMFPYEDYKYFIVFIDCFSNQLNLQPLKDKTSASVLKTFKNYLKDHEIEKLETDKGTEYSLCKKLCKEKNILYSFKRGENKANFAEHAILQVKKRLYKMLRGTLSKNWPEYLSIIQKDFNKTPNKKLGMYVPDKINDVIDTYIVLQNQNKSNLKNEIPSLEEQQKNEEEYNKNNENLKVKDYVYLNLKADAFSKSFDVQVKYF
jgi:hypothetical protein